jgi:alkylation response protein AidB-like acyl-CoA dehydrogenase
VTETTELDAFRREVRAWLEESAPRSLRGTSQSGPFDGFWGGKKHPEVPPDVLAWRDACLERGFTAPTWPKEYGGAGLSGDHAKVLYEEMRALGLPRPVVGFGFAMIGPTLLQFGNEAQKQEHLPKIVSGAVRWCQGYSEPNAGSDLANVQLKGERDGDDFILNGQKIWTSHADKSDFIFCLVRTNPTAKKQAGITFLLVDMETPGVTPRKIDLISGSSPFCETFFENVRVPVTNVVSEIDRGWTVAKALLGHERSMIGQSIGQAPGSGQQEIVAKARKHLGAPGGDLPDPLLRDAVAAFSMDEAAFQLTLTRIQQSTLEGKAPGHETSITKIAATELKQQRFELGMRIAGAEGLGWEGEGFDDDDLAFTREWLRSRANTIEGGSSEIQLNIIAKQVLGLPDGK